MSKNSLPSPNEHQLPKFGFQDFDAPQRKSAIPPLGHQQGEVKISNAVKAGEAVNMSEVPVDKPPVGFTSTREVTPDTRDAVNVLDHIDPKFHLPDSPSK